MSFPSASSSRYDYLQPYAIYSANATNVKNIEGSWRILAHKISSLQSPEIGICCVRLGTRKRSTKSKFLYPDLPFIQTYYQHPTISILLWRDIYVISFCFRIVFPCTGASSIVISFRPFFAPLKIRETKRIIDLPHFIREI